LRNVVAIDYSSSLVHSRKLFCLRQQLPELPVGPLYPLHRDYLLFGVVARGDYGSGSASQAEGFRWHN